MKIYIISKKEKLLQLNLNGYENDKQQHHNLVVN